MTVSSETFERIVRAIVCLGLAGGLFYFSFVIWALLSGG